MKSGKQGLLEILKSQSEMAKTAGLNYDYHEFDPDKKYCLGLICCESYELHKEFEEALGGYLR